MSTLKSYALVRVLPDGTEKRQGPVSGTRAATVLAAHVLCDNAGVTKADAQRFSVTLGAAALGSTIHHEASGYSFRVVQS